MPTTSRFGLERLAKIAVMASNTEVEHKVTRESWLEQHPKFKEIQSYGYYNEKLSLTRAAIAVYLDLCESKHWFSVCIHRCESLKLVYITGKRTKKSQFDVVVPLTIDTALTTEEIQNIIQEVNLCEDEEMEEETDINRSRASSKVTMAFYEADSTIVYYDFFQGLVPPDPPTEEEEVKPKRKRTRPKKYKPSSS